MASSAFVSNLSYDPEENKPPESKSNIPSEDSTQKSPVDNNSMLFEKIAHHLNSASKITHQLSSNGDSKNGVQPKSSPEKGKNTLQIITEIWEKQLNKTGIGPNQHFFDVGGTSLKAVEVLSQLNVRFNKNLTIVSLFEHSTIQSLANLVVEDTPSENNEFSKIMKRATSRRDRLRQRN